MNAIVESKHPDYDTWFDRWAEVFDAWLGQDRVKSRGTLYLPMPSGMSKAPSPSDAYNAYRLRAQYPDIVAPTVRGMVGIMHGKPAEYKLPAGMEDMRWLMTKDRTDLEGMHRRISRNVLLAGRYGSLIDAAPNGGRIYIENYKADKILNWDLDDDGRLYFLLLNECGPKLDISDGQWREVRRFRLCELIDGVYRQRIFEWDPESQPRETTVFPERRGGGTLDFIPFVVHGSNDMTPDPDELPLLGLARIAATIYRTDADYRHALYMTSQPTPVAIGVADAKSLPGIGSSVLWALPEGGNAKYLEFSGQGVDAQRRSILDDLDRAVALGARLLSDQSGREESGEAKRMRMANDRSTLTTIAQAVGHSVERALQYAATMNGDNPDAIDVKPNLDFSEARMTPQEIDGLVKGWLAGAYSYPTLFANLKRGEIIDQERTEAEEREAIEDDLERMMARELSGSPPGGGDLNSPPSRQREDDQ